jgi:hypothetical protein
LRHRTDSSSSLQSLLLSATDMGLLDIFFFFFFFFFFAVVRCLREHESETCHRTDG